MSDGRFIAYASTHELGPMSPSDPGGSWDVFVRDMTEADTTLRIATQLEAHPSISSDGRYVSVSTAQANVVQVQRYDRQLSSTSTLEALGANAPNGDASARTFCAAQGALVVYSSSATNLVGGDTNGTIDVFSTRVP